MPYGDKSEEALKSYVSAIMMFLKEKQCKLVVVACNSAATVISKIPELPFPKENIIEVISPIVDLIATQTKYAHIGVIGTRKTIGSGMFNDALTARNHSLDIVARATPLLVPLIEEGFVDENILYPVFDRYFDGFEKCKLIIPACTHYPMLYKQIEAYFQHSLKVLHTPKIVAEYVEKRLIALGLRNTSIDTTSHDIYHLSDVTDDFVRSAAFFLEKEVTFQRTPLPLIH